jgi:outer membrane protein assembly factor BamA
MGGDVEFLKNELKFSYFIPMLQTELGRQVLAVNISGSTVDNIFSSKEVPSYEKYFLGGSNDVRGYGDRTIKFYDINGDNYGANSETYFNLEYRIPLVKDTISTVMFYDGGNIHKKPLSMSTENWRFGYGFGFRIRTPMGDLRLDWARRINETYPGANDKGQTEIHFNIGNMF